MLVLQQELNDATNGKGWEKGLTKNGKQIDWRRCIFLEAAELIDSYPWKHWKNIDAEADYENIKIEAVDIWHFVMSEALRLYKLDNLGSLEDLALMIIKQKEYKQIKTDILDKHLSYNEEIAIIEEFIASLFCDNSVEILISKFFTVAKQSGLTLDTLYALYIGKNILNQFRQDHGYKEGNYIKEWYGKEDNVAMQTILTTYPEISPKELYKRLKELYPG